MLSCNLVKSFVFVGMFNCFVNNAEGILESKNQERFYRCSASLVETRALEFGKTLNNTLLNIFRNENKCIDDAVYKYVVDFATQIVKKNFYIRIFNDKGYQELRSEIISALETLKNDNSLENKIDDYSFKVKKEAIEEIKNVLISGIENIVDNFISVIKGMEQHVPSIVLTDNGLSLKCMDYASGCEEVYEEYKNEIFSFGYHLYEILESKGLISNFNNIFDFVRILFENDPGIFIEFKDSIKEKLIFNEIISQDLIKILNESDKVFKDYANRSDIIDDVISSVIKKLLTFKKYELIKNWGMPIRNGGIDVFYGIRVPEISSEISDIINTDEYKTNIENRKKVLVRFFKNEIFDELGKRYTAEGVVDSIINLLEKANGMFGIDISYVKAFVEIDTENLRKVVTSLLDKFIQRLPDNKNIDIVLKGCMKKHKGEIINVFVTGDYELKLENTAKNILASGLKLYNEQSKIQEESHSRSEDVFRPMTKLAKMYSVIQSTANYLFGVYDIHDLAHLSYKNLEKLINQDNDSKSYFEEALVNICDGNNFDIVSNFIMDAVRITIDESGKTMAYDDILTIVFKIVDALTLVDYKSRIN